MKQADWGRIGGLTAHSRHDSREMTAPARRGWFAKFEREVDPDGVLDAAERTKRANRAMRAYMLRMSHKAVAAKQGSGASRRDAPTRDR